MSQRELTDVDPEGVGGEDREPSLEGYSGPSKAERFVEMVRDGRKPPATAHDALAVTAVTETAYGSARTDERVDVADVEFERPASTE